MVRHASPKRRSGQVIVLAPVMVAALGGILALTADLGGAFVEHSRLQNTADAAALAAAYVLVDQRAEGQTEVQARQHALAEAVAIQQANRPQAGMTLQFGHRDQTGAFVPADEATPATAVSVTAARNQAAPGGPVRFAFAALLGIRSCELDATGICEATANIRGVRGNLSPFAVPKERIVPPGQTMVFYPAGGDISQGHGHETVAAGNWGLLNLDGGSCNTPELREWILHGYNGEIVIGDEGYIWFDGTPGFRTTLESEVRDRIGDSLTMVIYDQVIDQGSNANYRCVGFLRAIVLECDLHGQNAHLSCRVDRVLSVHDVITGGSCPSPNMEKIQLVY